jgi:hypothetical protein
VTAWATLAEARRDWPDADDALLTDLLELARVKCATFGPVLDDPDVPPVGWSYAQVLTARDVWQAARRQGDFIGFDAYAVRVRPLLADVQGILRPYVGRPAAV